MKIRTTKYIIKEGILNTVRNKLMSLASVSIVAATLLIFGVFLFITINLNLTMQEFGKRPQIQVYLKPELDDTQVAKIQESIKNDPLVKEYTLVSKEEAFEIVKEEIIGQDVTMDGIDASIMPVSYIVKLIDPSQTMKFVEKFSSSTDVLKVEYSQNELDFIYKASYWVRLISIILVVILLVVGMFIISNTIKLTVFARRREIGIMKYIGATDWFIRWPFIIEGILIGVFGAAIAFILASYGYNAVERWLSTDFKSYANIIRIVKLNEIGLFVLGIYTIIGVLIGSIGSFISIRKYLHV